jgi:hypothetical protein
MFLFLFFLFFFSKILIISNFEFEQNSNFEPVFLTYQESLTFEIVVLFMYHTITTYPKFIVEKFYVVETYTRFSLKFLFTPNVNIIHKHIQK